MNFCCQTKHDSRKKKLKKCFNGIKHKVKKTQFLSKKKKRTFTVTTT